MNDNIKKYGKIIAWIVVPTLLIAFVYMIIYMRKKKIGFKQLPKELKKEIKNVDFKKKLGMNKKEDNVVSVVETINNNDLEEQGQENKDILEKKAEPEKNIEKQELVKNDIKN